MARERFSLVSEIVKEEAALETKIIQGEINADNFISLPLKEQEKVRELLFKLASDKINPNQGASALEFTLFGFMRIMSKMITGMSLTAEDKKIKASIERIMEMHQITNDDIYMKDWLFDYMAYAEQKAAAILRNRAEHIDRKVEVTGKP